MVLTYYSFLNTHQQAFSGIMFTFSDFSTRLSAEPQFGTTVHFMPRMLCKMLQTQLKNKFHQNLEKKEKKKSFDNHSTITSET